MHGYIALYNGKQVEIHADSLYAAHLKAVEHFKPPKSKKHLVSTHLVEKAGEQVTTVVTS
jgi:hypothetical protein